MSLEMPPREIVYQIHSRWPSFWQQFFTYANAAMSTAWNQGARFSMTSWWRSPSKNAAVGGAPNSQHLWGTAFDLVASTPAGYQQLEAALRARGFFTIRESDHLHVQAFPAGVLPTLYH